MVNVYVFDIGSICIHGEELPGNFTLHQKYRKNLTMKQMFDISEKLIAEQSDEIYGVNTIHSCDSAWKHSSFVNAHLKCRENTVKNICEKWLRETSEMNYSITTRRIRTESSMTQMLMTTETMPQRTSPLA